MFRDTEMDNSATLVRQQDEYKQDAAGQGRHREEVHRQ